MSRELEQSSCRFCEGSVCTQWNDLPTSDTGRGICEYCQRAITLEWPAIKNQDPHDPTIMHYHQCPHIPPENT